MRWPVGAISTTIRTEKLQINLKVVFEDSPCFLFSTRPGATVTLCSSQRTLSAQYDLPLCAICTHHFLTMLVTCTSIRSTHF